jgi:hypothetical protein
MPCNITVQKLLDAGYRSFHERMAADSYGSYYLMSFEKWIVDGIGKRYGMTIRHGEFPHGPFFAPTVQFTRGSLTFNVELLVHEETIAQIEAFFEEQWLRMKADYYEKSHWRP